MRSLRSTSSCRVTPRASLHPMRWLERACGNRLDTPLCNRRASPPPLRTVCKPDMARTLSRIFCIILFTVSPCVHAEGVLGPTHRPAIMVERAAYAALMDVTRAGDRMVAVGEHGIVILSDDSGRSWRQAKVPVSVTLTAVKFP